MHYNQCMARNVRILEQESRDDRSDDYLKARVQTETEKCKDKLYTELQAITQKLPRQIN
jgi:hypothetical protein